MFKLRPSGPRLPRFALTLAAVAVASGCDATLPAPHDRHPAPEGLAAEAASGSQLVGTWSGSTAMAVPGTVTTGFGLRPTGVPLPPNSYVLLRIGGTMIVEGNPYSGGAQPGSALFSLSAEESRRSTGDAWTSVYLGGEILTPLPRRPGRP